MLTLYDNAFSPFARKVRMVLEHKGLAFEAIDGLRRSNHERIVRIKAVAPAEVYQRSLVRPPRSPLRQKIPMSL
jgi:hypothetical protein